MFKRHTTRRRCIAVFACGILALLLAAGVQGEEISFSRDIQPILSDNCFQCHGPDENSREADLRLDREADLLAVATSEDSEDESDMSELLRRITSADPDEVMPPAESKRTLTETHKSLIRQWISEGAKWEGHWSFQKPTRPALPTISKEDWPANEVDHFILARLEENKLSPSPTAKREKWLRRVTLDLTGLPPTIEELDLSLIHI